MSSAYSRYAFDKLLASFRVGHTLWDFPDIVAEIRNRPLTRIRAVSIPATYLRDKGVDYVPPRNGRRRRNR